MIDKLTLKQMRDTANYCARHNKQASVDPIRLRDMVDEIESARQREIESARQPLPVVSPLPREVLDLINKLTYPLDLWVTFLGETVKMSQLFKTLDWAIRNECGWQAIKLYLEEAVHRPRPIVDVDLECIAKGTVPSVEACKVMAQELLALRRGGTP